MTLPIPDLTLSGPYFNQDGSPNAQGLQLLRVINAVKARTGGIVSDGVSEASATATGGATQTLAEWMADVEAVTTGLADHLADTTAAHAASAISYAGGTGMSATDVESAIDELATEKLDASSYTAADVLSKLLTVDGAGSGLDADLLDGLSSAAFGQLALAATWTTLQTFQSTTAATAGVKAINTTDNASVQALRIEGDRATFANNDKVYASFYLSNGGGTQVEYARIVTVAESITAASEIGQIRFGLNILGSFAEKVVLSSSTWAPLTNDLIPLGLATLSWSDLFLASGGVINWANGNVVLTQSSGVLNLSTGALQVGGVSVRVAGKTGVPVPAGAMVARTTNGAAAGLTEGGTNRVMLATYDFDASTDEYVQFQVPAMPKSWNESTVTARFIWTATNTGNVIWAIQGVALSDDDPFDGAFGTAQTVTDGVTAANDVMKSAETSAVTIGGSPAEGDMVVFQVYRNASNGSDTCAVDAKLIGVELFVTTNAANDA